MDSAYWVGAVAGGLVIVGVVAALLNLWITRALKQSRWSAAVCASVAVCTTVAVVAGSGGDWNAAPVYAGSYSTAGILLILSAELFRKPKP